MAIRAQQQGQGHQQQAESIHGQFKVDPKSGYPCQLEVE